MRGENFFAAATGRIACATAALSLAVPGFMAMSGHGPYELPLIPLLTSVLVVGMIASAVLSTDRFPLHTVMLAITTPMVAFVYFMGLQLVAGLGATWGLGLLLAALVPLASAVAAPAWKIGATSGPAIHPAHSDAAHSHA
jgi:hypothetical protein